MQQEGANALVADSHPLCRSGMVALLTEFEFTPVQTANDYAHLRRALATGPAPRVVTVSFDLPGLDGAMGLRKLRLEWPNLRIVVLNDVADRDLVLEVLSAGVHGLIPKTHPEPQMRAAIEAVLKGQIYVPNIVCDLYSNTQSQGGKKSDARTPTVELTDRQMEVLKLLAAGKSNKEIARALQISEGTVKVHVNASFRALGVHNRVSAAAAISGLTSNLDGRMGFRPSLVVGGRKEDKTEENIVIVPLSA